MSEETPQLKAGKNVISFCPFCSAEFANFLTLNVEHECPEAGGCGNKFQIFSKSKFGEE